MEVTMGMQPDNEDPNEKEDNQEAEPVNRGASGSKIDDDPYGTRLNGNGQFVKICKGMCTDINQAMAARVAREAVETISEVAIEPDLCIQVLSELLAHSHCSQLRRTTTLWGYMESEDSLSHQIFAFIGEVRGVSGFTTVVNWTRKTLKQERAGRTQRLMTS